MESIYPSRRHDIDWLRNLAFILLIFYHIGMYYVADWGWHIKSQYQSEGLQDVMILLNQWRMPLIFMVSGMALSLVEERIRPFALLRLRFVRIFIPLVIGMYLIVAVQPYYEAVTQLGYSGSFTAFWWEYINPNTTLYPEHHHGPLGLLTWNHLWYLAYLWHYTLAYLVLRPFLRAIAKVLSASNAPFYLIILLPLAPLITYILWLYPKFPRTHALVDDWYTHAVYFTIFLYGYFLVKMPQVWETIIARRHYLLVFALLGYALIIAERHDLFSLDDQSIFDEWLTAFWISFNRWSWLLLVIGYAGAYLNKPSRWSGYLNEAVLPWYILHQSVIMVIAMQLAPFALGGIIEPLLLSVFTFCLCAVLYAVIRRVNLLRFCFGMKLSSNRARLENTLASSTR